MGYYNVVQPCVVGGRHYIRPAAQPIEADDAEAAPLVESGSLTPYQPGLDKRLADAGHKAGEDFSAAFIDHEGAAIGDRGQDPLPTGDFAPAESESEKPRRSRARRAEDSDGE
jgi:hypothetical protein